MSSPDEKALLEAAQNFGFCFLSRDFDTIKVNVFGRVRSFTVLHVLEFTGERKRMSVIVRDENDRILLLTKGTQHHCFLIWKYSNQDLFSGADGVILKRASVDQDLVSVKVVEDQATKLGNSCLRTLAIAYKNIKKSHYERWYDEYWKPSIEDYLNRQKIIDKASGKCFITILGR